MRATSVQLTARVRSCGTQSARQHRPWRQCLNLPHCQCAKALAEPVAHTNSRMDGPLDLERRTAAAALRGVGIVEREAALLEALVEVDLSAVQIKRAALVDGDLHAVCLGDLVLVGAGLVVEAEDRKSTRLNSSHT